MRGELLVSVSKWICIAVVLIVGLSLIYMELKTEEDPMWQTIQFQQENEQPPPRRDSARKIPLSPGGG